MKTETGLDLTSLNNEQLKTLYHKINSTLTKNLLNGAGIEAEHQRIQMLNKIAGELNCRNFATKTKKNDTPQIIEHNKEMSMD